MSARAELPLRDARGEALDVDAVEGPEDEGLVDAAGTGISSASGDSPDEALLADGRHDDCGDVEAGGQRLGSMRGAFPP